MEIIIEQPTVPVYMTLTDVELFKLFQKNYDKFAILASKGVFGIQTGKATLNFHNGELQTIEKQEIVWHK